MKFYKILRLTLKFLILQKLIVQETHRFLMFFTFHSKIMFTLFEVFIIFVCLFALSPKIISFFLLMTMKFNKLL